MVRLHEERDRHHSFPGGSGPVPQHEPQTTATDRLTLYGRGLMPLPKQLFLPSCANAKLPWGFGEMRRDELLLRASRLGAPAAHARRSSCASSWSPCSPGPAYGGRPRSPWRHRPTPTPATRALQPAADAVCALPSVRQWIRQREADGTAVVAIPPERDSKQVRPEVFLALPSLGRCLGRPGGGAMPLPEPGCARGWGVGGWSAAPRREGAREHVRFPGLRADADAAVALAPERLGGGRAPASAQARARRELQRRLEEHGVGAAVWPRAGAARVSLDQAEMPAHPPLRRLGPERHGVTRSDTGGHKGRVSSGSEELQEAFPRGSANGDSPPGRMAVERRRRECNSRTNA